MKIEKTANGFIVAKFDFYASPWESAHVFNKIEDMFEWIRDYYEGPKATQMEPKK